MYKLIYVQLPIKNHKLVGEMEYDNLDGAWARAISHNRYWEKDEYFAVPVRVSPTGKIMAKVLFRNGVTVVDPVYMARLAERLGVSYTDTQGERT